MWPFKKQYTPTITDLKPLLSEIKPIRQDTYSMAWRTPENEAIQIGLHSPCNWPFSPAQKNALLEKTAFDYWQAQVQSQQGALVELAVFDFQSIPAMQGIFKYRVPNTMALIYAGIIWLPFKDFLYQINIEAIEHGTTGMREAIVATLKTNEGKWPEQDIIIANKKQKAQPEHLESIEELFNKLRQPDLQRTQSDNAEYDSMFPHHPLSRVRTLLTDLRTRTRLNPLLCKQPFYNYP